MCSPIRCNCAVEKNNGLQHKALLVCLYTALNTRGSDAYSAI